MSPDLRRPVVFVELDVEEVRGVLAPHHAAVAVLDQVVEVLSGGPVAHPDRKIFRALDIGAPGLEPVVGRMPRAAEPEIFVVGGERIAVEDDVGVAAVARHPAEQFMLAAVAEFAEIGERTVGRGH